MHGPWCMVIDFLWVVKKLFVDHYDNTTCHDANNLD